MAYFRNLLQLWRLARKRHRSENDYREFQSFQAQLLVDYLERFGVELTGRRVLDLGSGIGGYSQYLAQHGADVISLDLMMPSQVAGLPLIGDALRLPLRDGSIDIVFCASLIEHVADPLRLLREIERVLRGGGFCYLSFPPYYSPLGGHEFSPWHYLGEKWALRLSNGRSHVPEWVARLYKMPETPGSFSEIYYGWGLYRMTIRKARRLIEKSNLALWDQSTRYLPVSAVRWPLLGEFLTWHAQFLLRKPG